MILDMEIYEDVKRWHRFGNDDEGDDICVYARCPECGRFLTIGRVWENFNEGVKLEGWKCKKHGEVEPYFERD